MTTLPPGDDWQPAPRVTEAQLTGSFWSFGTLGQGGYAPFLVLAPGNLIGNYQHRNEDLWQVIDGRLALVSDAGLTTTVFEAAQLRNGEIVALAGKVLVPGYDSFHELRRTAHPPHPVTPTMPQAPRRASFISALDRPRRPNLVVLRAGEGSLHPSWPRDIADENRNWDMCISSYAPNAASMLGQCEYLAHAPQQRKFQAIYDLFHNGSPLFGYDQVWLPDDDLMTSWSDINRLFHLTRRYGLDLSQPSLQQRPDCYIAHWFTGQQAQFVLRYIGFVEIMCPVFSQRALRICLGSFRDSTSGFGLDHLWPALLGGPRARMAVVDAVGVVHTRPMGLSYDVRQANAEEQAVLRAYGWTHYHLPLVPVPAP